MPIAISRIESRVMPSSTVFSGHQDLEAALLSLADVGAAQATFRVARGDTLLDTWIFAGKDPVVRDVWAAGRHVVRDGRHIERDAITSAYRDTLHRLRDVM